MINIWNCTASLEACILFCTEIYVSFDLTGGDGASRFFLVGAELLFLVSAETDWLLAYDCAKAIIHLISNIPTGFGQSASQLQ